MPKGNIMDALHNLDSDTASSDDDSAEEAPEAAPSVVDPSCSANADSGSVGVRAGPTIPAPAAAAASKRVKLTLEDLQRAGYQEGPSVLFMKPPAEEQQTNWEWSDGKQTKEHEPEAESYAERQATHRAAGAGAQEAAVQCQRMQLHAAKLREAAQAEKEQLARDKRLTHNQKEKRKRDEGKTTRAKNYVEEEKRLGRSLGMYSNFD